MRPGTKSGGFVSRETGPDVGRVPRTRFPAGGFPWPRLGACVLGVAAFAVSVDPPLLGSRGGVVRADEAIDSAWHTSYEAALAEAEASGRPVLVLFTGSDWCPHCKTLEKNVLESSQFREWFPARVVLLKIDLPQHGISDAVRAERSRVCIKYGVRNFPTVLVLGPDGTKLAEKRGYQGQAPGSWIADVSQALPVRAPAAAVAASAPSPRPVPAVERSGDDGAEVLDSLGKAIETARGTKRPILLVVARPGDKAAKSHSESLVRDPEFAPFVEENFVVAHVPPTAPSGSEEAASLENLLGGVELAPDAVELIVTDDGQTPLFSQSGAQPPARIVHGLRRFLAARQAARFGEKPVR